MGRTLANNYGNSGAEERFIQLFCEVFGPEKGQYVYLQYPILDIYGKHRSIDFAIRSNIGKVAFEIDGNTWHNPSVVSNDKYEDDLLKQNSMVHDGWKIFRWTDNQVNKCPERIKDELQVFLGTSPVLFYMEDNLPEQSGEVFQLRDHQEEALTNLDLMRREGKTIALVQGATGSGKSAIGVLDAKSFGRRTLFLAHTKELVEQGFNNFNKLWPEAKCGRFYESYHEKDAKIICASIQSISQNIEDFSPYDFEYLIIDECHHASASTYKKILSYFKTQFTLGLTATPERMDGEDLLAIFQTVAHKLDIKEAVEAGVLCPVRCIRIKTNIDLSDVRINGFKYNSQDLETSIMVPGRNQLIVETYQEFVKSKSTVMFGTSVNHADTVAEMFKEKGIPACSVSGHTNPIQRKQILKDYANGEIKVLCACDLLNEGWDSPNTEVLFMARPTMSKTLYMQQLGRGMRTYKNKGFLMVFDFVDNANMFNSPYSLHRLLNIDKYRPGQLVLGKESLMKWDEDMFNQGNKPEALLDYPIHATDYETIDLFNWQEKAKEMISIQELTRRVSVQIETVERYVKEGKLRPDLEIPINQNHSFKYFDPKRLTSICKEFGWTLITNENIKQLFLNMVKDMNMTLSYKPVFLKAFFNNLKEDGTASLESVVQEFTAFYEKRKTMGLPAEKKQCIFTRENGYTQKDAEKLILTYPFKRFEDMNFITHAKYMGIIQLNKHINLTQNDISNINTMCDKAIEAYFNK